MLNEAKKIIPLKDVFSDIHKWSLMQYQAFSYNQNLSTKCLVAFQLYYNTLANLGTDRHQHLKDRSTDLEDIGCFALTELGHGSNARDIQTTATYDKETKEFIISSPTQEAMKFWIGGAYKTSNVSAVFAQLIINGKSYGPHAFVVPIRDSNTKKILKGVTIGDCGKKSGLDGVDNGFIIFNDCRIPREFLLNRFSDVTEDGSFISDIKNHDKRFGLQLCALSGGRIQLTIGNQ
mmetsp:Transcript_36417/g.35287  ORF Transcript_36417/g.35287 Transcript_36417/m.35287 type:complete len:234 (+) Transcript_36417:319-1020(+)|eukprot:CAMPEP_0170548390 /NCGR_PEP_ID=MMETSP0211-20121228/6715_1 /TAXON_ID=311385 /ORGANISM="Pseudokeronopsis sp., Strain OXSARD2" /LENGTH=233 /DNA_ID=CAMNT_0010853921 /DNA_START=243 /DNA_END=944 /DNA_ORIENTATION=-